MITRQIPLTRGLVAVVDKVDYDVAFAAGPWNAHPDRRTFYAQKTLHLPGRDTSVRLHSLLTGWPLVDHINGDGLDNRRANLRRATHAQNQANQRRSLANRSGFKGVSFYQRHGQWQSVIQIGGRKRHLGYFPTPRDAARAYDAAAIEAWGEYARLNFPGERLVDDFDWDAAEHDIAWRRP